MRLTISALGLRVASLSERSGTHTMRRSAVLLLSLGSLVFHSSKASAQNYYGDYVIGDKYSSPYSFNPGFQKGEYKKALKKGDSGVACMNAVDVAMSYLDGKKGGGSSVEKLMKPDEAQAIEWFQKASSSCSVEDGSGHGFDALMYGGYVGYRFLGQGTPAVKPNTQLAEFWLLKSAKGYSTKYGTAITDSNAAYNLAVAYLKGDVLPQNNEQAVHWLEVAVTHRNAHATRLLGELYRDGKVVPQDIPKSTALLASAPELEAKEGHKHLDEVAAREQGQRDAAQAAAESHNQMMAALSQGLSNLQNQMSNPAPNPIQQAAEQNQANIAAIQAAGQRQQQRQVEQQEQHQAAPAVAPMQSSNGSGLCPNGKYLDATTGCDCRAYSAAQNCLNTRTTNQASSTPPPAMPGPPSPEPPFRWTPPPPPPPAQTTTTNTQDYVSGLPQCVGISYEKNMLFLTNTCGVRVTVVSILGIAPGHIHRGLGDIQAGQRDGGLWSANEINSNYGGKVNVYTCPYGYIAREANGSEIIFPVTQYRCHKVY